MTLKRQELLVSLMAVTLACNFFLKTSVYKIIINIMD